MLHLLQDNKLDPGTPAQNTIAGVIILIVIILVIVGSTKGGK